MSLPPEKATELKQVTLIHDHLIKAENREGEAVFGICQTVVAGVLGNLTLTPVQIGEDLCTGDLMFRSNDENGVNRPVCSYVRVRQEQWCSMWSSSLCRNKGDCEDHATLLCSLLLGFGLDGRMCGHQSQTHSTHLGHDLWYRWLHHLLGSFTAHRYLHRPIDPDAPPMVPQLILQRGLRLFSVNVQDFRFIRSPFCEEIVCCRRDHVRLVVRVRVFAYPVSACAVWIMFAGKYRSVL